jgi:branched-chain amino acid transport system ATP-binding protein
MLNELLGSSIGDFIGVTLVLFGGSAFMTGQALAGTWRPAWQMVPYGLLLAAANRFFSWALFEGQLLSPAGYAIDAIVLVAIGMFAYRLMLAHRMSSQYPWLYERAGLLSWRTRAGGSATPS